MIHSLFFIPKIFGEKIFILGEFAVSLLIPHSSGIYTHAKSPLTPYILTICLLSLFLMVSNNLVFTIKLHLTLSH